MTAAQTAAPAVSEGLTTREAAARLRQFGPNAVAVARPHGVGALPRKFGGVVPVMLELAVIMDLVLGRRGEAVVIAGLLGFKYSLLLEPRAHLTGSNHSRYCFINE